MLPTVYENRILLMDFRFAFWSAAVIVVKPLILVH